MVMFSLNEGRGADIMRSRPHAHDPHGFDVAMMTANEFVDAINPKGRWHEDSCYDTTLANMNSITGGGQKSKYTHLLRTLTIRGMKFEFRLQSVPNKYSDPVLAKARNAPPNEFSFGVFNEDNQIVASAQDEWGAMLIMTAREYRSFGIGSILLKLARDMLPGKDSGGLTNAGGKAVRRYHRDSVRDALNSGLYMRLVKSRAMTVERVKEIVNSALLELRPKKLNLKLSSNDPTEWLLFGSPYGSFILYDRKLKDAIEAEMDEFFLEKLVKGMVYMEIDNNDNARIKVFGGSTPAIKTLILRVAITWAETNHAQLWVEPNDIQFLPKDSTIGPKVLTPGYYAHAVSGPTIDIKTVIAQEAEFRKFDKHREFESRLYELAEGIFKESQEAEKEYS